MKNQQPKKNPTAFSLIEVLVSLFIFSVAIVGVVGFMTLEIKKSTVKRNETIAGQLAQEGIELVRNIRDNNWMNARTAFFGIGNGNYRIDFNDNGILSSGSDFELYLDNATKLYSYGAGAGKTQTAFQRKIIVTGAGASRRVSSVVVWENDSMPILIESDLANCNVANKCFYTQVTLTDKWGENL